MVANGGLQIFALVVAVIGYVVWRQLGEAKARDKRFDERMERLRHEDYPAWKAWHDQYGPGRKK